MMSADPAERAAWAAALATVFRTNLKTFALVFNTIVKDKEIEDRWRKYTAPESFRHLTNEVEPEVVDALVTAVRAAYPKLSHRYYAMKARWLGKDALEYWDRNAPLPGAPDAAISWDEARGTVLDAYRAFSPAMAKIAQMFFDKNWIDAPLRPGKTSGAFSHSTVPSAHPYVLLNYQGHARDVMTLAHELGHGVHQVLAGKQGYFQSQTPLTLAETASVFGEMLTFQALLARSTDPTLRRALLAGKVEDMLNTVVRQIAFYSFEQKIHAARRSGELTAADISALWLEIQRESLGPAVKQNDGYESYWCYISHFIHSPFYVYAYAFGDCLVNALYARYEAEPAGFGEKYLALLEAGGTLGHRALLKPFGLDATDPGFWSLGLDRIAGMIDELEAMG
jgi:oligoendopeptidase F